VLLFSAAVVGGVSSPAGALLGATYFQLTNNFLAATNQVLLRTALQQFGPLVIVFVAPGGFISLVNAVRDNVLRIVAQRRRIIVPSLFADYDPAIVARQLIPLAQPETSMGLAALPVGTRHTLESDLYKGSGVERERAGNDAAALGAAARSVGDVTEVA
jgi:hypothetical protein